MYAFLLALLVVGLDQATKFLVVTRMEEFAEVPLIPGFFSLQFVHNPGAAFGMLAGQQWLFITVSLAAVGAMIYFVRHPEAQHPLLKPALGLLLGGSLGNLIDRVRFGEVVDFFLFYYKNWSFPNFNVADIAINVGVGLFILHLILTGESHKREGV